MSFLVKQPSNPQSQLDTEPRSSYSEAQTIPLGFGQNFFASQWLCDAYHRRTAPAGSQQPDHQYASIAAKFRAGPIVYVGAVKRDGKIVYNLDYVFGPNEDQHEFTIQPNMKGGYSWKLILRRGTETQTSSAELRTATGQQHPPYRGDVWGEWINIPLGQGTTAIPDLQLELRTEVPEVGGFGGGVHTYHGVNPIAAIYTLARETRGGLAASGSLFDPEHWGERAVALEAVGVGGRTGSLTGIHPVISSPRSAGAVFSDILSYFDGYLYADAGQLKVGWFPNRGIDTSALPEIREADLTEKPGGAGFGDWNTSPASAAVVFTEQGRFYNKEQATCPAPANAEEAIVTTPVRKDRPWIHTMEQAAIIAAEIVNEPSGDDSGVTLSVLTSRLDAAGLVPGSLFRWDYGPHALDLVCRITSRRTRAGSTSDTITVVRERGAYPTPYVPPIDERVEPTVDDPGEVTAADVRLWIVPPGLRGSDPAVAVLINRGKLEIVSATIALSANGAEPWADVLTQNFWAAKCALVSPGISASGATLRVTSSSVDFPGMEAQNAVAQGDDALLLVVEGETMSVGAITAVSSNTYDLQVLRGRRGTAGVSHSAGQSGWLVRRSELLSIAHQEFARVHNSAGAYSASAATKFFKVCLATSKMAGRYAPADPGLSVTLPNSAPAGLVMVSSAADMQDVAPVFYPFQASPSNPNAGKKQSAGKLKWAAAVGRRVAFYELTVSRGPALEYISDPTGDEPVGFTPHRTNGAECVFIATRAMAFSSTVWWVRAVYDDGSMSRWIGPAPESMTDDYGTQDMAEQSSSGIAVTGGSATGLSVVSAVEVIETSSRRYKRNIRPISRPMALLRKLQGIRFDQRRGGKRGRIGFPAEETHKVLPAMVRLDGDGRPDGVAYGPIVALCVEALKQQDREHRADIRALRKQLAALQRRLPGAGRRGAGSLQRARKAAAEPSAPPASGTVDS